MEERGQRLCLVYSLIKPLVVSRFLRDVTASQELLVDIFKRTIESFFSIRLEIYAGILLPPVLPPSPMQYESYYESET